MRLIDADALKDLLEYCILCNVPADAKNTREEELNDWIQGVVDRQDTVEAITKTEFEKVVGDLHDIAFNKISEAVLYVLIDLKSEIEEHGLNYAIDIIDEKINALKKNKDKEVEDGNNR